MINVGGNFYQGAGVDTTEIMSQLAEKAKQTDVNNSLALKADKIELQAVASGSPKGVYTTVSALQTAFPTGNTNIYLVTGNVKEVDSLSVTASPTASGNVTITLNGAATPVTVTIGTAEVASLSVTAGSSTTGNATVTLDGVATNVAVQAGVAEVASLTVTAAATASENVTVTLNGVATNVAVLATDTAIQVADKIRAASFAGWTTGGTAGTATVTFTATAVGVKTDATYSAGTTGATGTMTTTTQGVEADTATDIATKIRATAFTGWTTGGTGTTVTFTANAVGVKTDAIYSAGTTGATGTMSTTTQGVAADTSTDVATKIRATAFAGWTTGGTGTTVTFTATAVGTKTAPSYSAGSTGVTGTMSVTTAGVDADGQWYYWNGSAWTAGGVYQSTGLAPGSVTIDKLGDTIPSKNLFNKDTRTIGKFVNQADGTLQTNVSYDATDYIPVQPSTVYTRTWTHQMAFYTSSKVYISGVNDVGGDIVTQFTTPANCYYVRLTLNTSATFVDKFQVELGSASTAYEKYGFKFKYVTPYSPSEADIGIIKQFIRGKNLFDKTKVTDGQFINYTNGALNANTSYAATDYIDVDQSTQYSISFAHQMAFYNASKAYISGINGSGSAGSTFTTPAGAKYIRFTAPSVSNSGLSSKLLVLQFEKGSAETAYEPFGFTVDGLTIDVATFKRLLGAEKIPLTQLTETTPAKNLFDKTKATAGQFINYLTGALQANASYMATDYMPVDSSTQYFQSYSHQTAFYDVNKAYISGLNSAAPYTTGRSFTTPANAKFVRASLANGVIDTFQVEKGGVQTGYQPFGYAITGLRLEQASIDAILASSANQKIGVKQLNEATPGKNLFDKSTVTLDNYVVYTSGALAANTTYNASDYIPVLPNTVYTRTYSHYLAFYDTDKVFISGLDRAPEGVDATTQITTPANCYFIRQTVHKNVMETLQIEAGSVATSYEPFGYKLSKVIVEASTNPTTIHGPTDIVLPRKVYVLKDKTMQFFYKNFCKSINPLLNVKVTASKGKIYSNKYTYSPTVAETKSLTVAMKDMNYNTVKQGSTTMEAVDKTANTIQVNYVAIGDSITRNENCYARTVQNELTNAKTVGTRTYDDGVLNVEGRGGWTLSQYMTQFGHASWGDSPFLFPIGVAGAKYKGNTAFWKSVCYTDPNGYDFQGFQKMARGWGAPTDSFLYDANGYPVSPVLDDVVVDPTKAAGATILKYDGAAWVAMSPQPAIEFSFAKYIERNSVAFGVYLPNVVSILLGTNDFFTSVGISSSINLFIDRIRQVITSIQAYNSSIKIILNMALPSATQDGWANANQITQQEYQFDRNMQDLGIRYIQEFDNDTELANKIYLCPMNAVLDKADITDHVHPNTTNGHPAMGLAIAALIQKIR